MNYEKRFDPAIILILLFILLAHIQLLFNDFHTDDFQILMIMEDGFDRQEFFFMENLSNFRPFTNLVIYVRSLVFDNIPALWYLLNILLHLCVVYMLYSFVRSKSGKTAAVVAALYFGVYFQHFEAVLWLYGIVRLLAASMLMLTVIHFINYRESSSRIDLIKSLLFFSVALFTVEDSIIFSLFFCLVLLIDRGERTKKFDYYGSGYIPAAAVYLFLRFTAMGWSKPSTEYYYPGYHIFHNYLEYCGWMIFPNPGHPYVYPFIEKYASFFSPFGGIINYLSLTLFVILMIFIIVKGNKIEKFALGFVLIALVMPSLLMAKVSTKLIYIPSLGMALIVGSIFKRLKDNISVAKFRYFTAAAILYLVIQTIAVNITIYYYRITQNQVSDIVNHIEKLNINWDDYEYLILDNLPGRVRPGHAIKYRLKIDKHLIINNRETENQPDITAETQNLKNQNISFILLDFVDKEMSVKEIFKANNVQ